jgi:hypothetical protein
VPNGDGNSMKVRTAMRFLSRVVTTVPLQHVTIGLSWLASVVLEVLFPERYSAGVSQNGWRLWP